MADSRGRSRAALKVTRPKMTQNALDQDRGVHGGR